MVIRSPSCSVSRTVAESSPGSAASRRRCWLVLPVTMLSVSIFGTPALSAQDSHDNGFESFARVSGEVALTTGVAVLGAAAYLTARYRVEPVFESPFSSAGEFMTTMLPALAVMTTTVVGAAEIGDRERFTEAAVGAGFGAMAGGALASVVGELFDWSSEGKFAGALVGAGTGAVTGFLIGGLLRDDEDDLEDESGSFGRVQLIKVAFTW